MNRPCRNTTPGDARPQILLRFGPPGRAFTAFTLIELMVVIGLIGILSAAILPSMRGTYDDAVLRAGGRELMNVFQLASSRAVTLNQVQRVRLDRSSGRYALEAPAPSDSTRTEFAPARDVPGGAGTIDSRIAISVRLGGDEPSDESEPVVAETGEGSLQDGTVFTFYPDGTADAAEVRLQDAEGFQLALKVNPVTARVRVVDAPRE